MGLLSEEKYVHSDYEAEKQAKNKGNTPDSAGIHNQGYSTPRTQHIVCWLRGTLVQFPEISFLTILYHLLN